MTNTLRKTGIFLLRGAVVLIALLLLAQAMLTVAVALSDARGLVVRETNAGLDGTGYSVALENLSYDPVRGLTLHGIAVSDAQGPFLTVDRLSVSVSLLSAPWRTLSVSAHGGTLDWKRLPATPASTSTDDSMPDIYFRTIRIAQLSFDRALLGDSYTLSPLLQGRVTFNDDYGFQLKLSPRMPPLAAGLPAPAAIVFDGALSADTNRLDIRKAGVTAASYALDLHGKLGLDTQGALDLGGNFNISNLAPLTDGALEKAAAEFILQGSTEKPVLGGTATVTPLGLRQKGLSDIAVTITPVDATSRLHAAATYRDAPATLDAVLSYAGTLLKAETIKASAAALSASGNLTYDTDKAALNGKITVAANDLAAYSELAGAPLAGRLDASAVFNPRTPALALDLRLSNAAYGNLHIGKLAAQTSLNTLAAGWPPAAKLDASAVSLGNDIAFDKLSAAITAPAPDNFKLSFNGIMRAEQPLTIGGEATLSGLARDVPDIRGLRITARAGRAHASLAGSLTQGIIDLALNGSGIRGKDIPLDLPAQFSNVRIDIAGAMKGSLAEPRTDMTLSLRDIAPQTSPDAVLALTAAHDGTTVSLHASGKGRGLRALTADAAFPATLSLMPFHTDIGTATALGGALNADIDLASVAPLFLAPTQSLSGILSAKGRISGTLGTPAVDADLRLSRGAFKDSVNGIVLADLAAEATVAPGRLTIERLSGTDGRKGRLSGSGTLSADSATRVTLTLRDFNAPRADLANGMIDTNLSLTGSNRNYLLAGDVGVSQMHITIPEAFSGNIPELNIVEQGHDGGIPLLSRLALDISIAARNQIFVRGWGLDAEFGGDIALGGTAAAPLLDGTLALKRGKYEEFGKHFTLTRANLRFQGEAPPSPYLDVEATVPAGDVTGIVTMSGSAASPKIAFSSTPALPDDEALSRILFSKESAKISPFQAMQLAQTLRRFSGKGGGVDAVGILRGATGLDNITVDTDANDKTSVGVGKYLTDKVYLEVSKGSAEQSGAATLQIEMTPSLNLQSRFGQDAQSGGGIFWKRDY